MLASAAGLSTPYSPRRPETSECVITLVNHTPTAMPCNIRRAPIPALAAIVAAAYHT
jgi:hypothetical protein